MKVIAVYCHNCKYVVYSRADHDMRSCPCQMVSIDGGVEYSKLSYEKDAKYDIIRIDIPFTEKELYDDWNNGVNALGIIKGIENVGK